MVSTKKPDAGVYDDDFGFSFISSEETIKLQEKVVEQEKLLESVVPASYKERLLQMHGLISNFLNNLAVNPEKDTIYWPQRTVKVKAFIKKIDDILGDA